MFQEVDMVLLQVVVSMVLGGSQSVCKDLLDSYMICLTMCASRGSDEKCVIIISFKLVLR